MENEHEFLFVTAEEEGVRIDKLLVSKFPYYSRTYFQHLLDIGCVLLNGEPVKKRVVPEEGDEIEVCFQAMPEASLEPESIPLEILYEDEAILAINKPAGMVVHPAPGHWSGTFVNALLAHCKEKIPGTDPMRPGIVHRLDKDTTGVLLAAKTLPAHQKLIEMFSTQKMEKLYLAICQGKPTNRIIEMPIGRHPVHRKEMTVLPDGREAITEIQVAACNDRASLVLAKPKTGRTHQIRVHLKHIGCPIIGDPLYGKGELHPRPLLHAYRLSFLHPINGMPIRLVAPIPEDMKEWLRKLCGPSLCMNTL
ncbi:MAG: RluA family pseudouridine synthase [Verrucomicrobia bacterium]|nr:RluA family pseudouridine synthase [Verrucomicrobiota bacterium]MDE3047758.1 RluA family pseudouridine synthase [Verrucomicrobiota bacterium]